jgi:hypothetical protein
LRDGIDTGIQAANEQLSQTGDEILDATREAGQQFGQQLQEFAREPSRQLQSTADDLRVATEQTIGAVGSGLQQVNPFGASSSQGGENVRSPAGVAPPPSWPQARGSGSPASSVAGASGTAETAPRGVAPTRTETGWTSIGTNVVAPPLVVPEMTAPSASRGSDGWPLRMADNSGPSFPATVPGRDETDRHQAQPQRAATIGRSGNASPMGSAHQDSNLVSVQPLPGSQNSSQAADGWTDPWGETDPWAQPAQSTPASAANQYEMNPGGAMQNAGAEWQVGDGRTQPNAGYPTNPVQTRTAAGTPNPGGHVLGQAQPNAATPVASSPNASPLTTEQRPWLPLLVVSLSLMGSLSANLFLGWSYLDARQKYRSLVRKTADTFRRVATSAVTV